MSAIVRAEKKPEQLSEAEARLAYRASETIARFLGEEGRLRLTLARDTGEKIETTVPSKALRLVASLLHEMARGIPVSVISVDTELTTRQAALVLQVSRPYLIKLLETGQLPYHKVGTHRRIRFEDVLAFQQHERARRHGVMQDLVAETERLDLYR